MFIYKETTHMATSITILPLNRHNDEHLGWVMTPCQQSQKGLLMGQHVAMSNFFIHTNNDREHSQKCNLGQPH